MHSLISVVICTYNRGAILHHCLDAILEQTNKDAIKEVIVVNNNCTDRTSDVVASYDGSGVIFREVYEEKQGLNNARNRGIQESTTPLVALLDDDGRPHRTWIEAIVKFIEQHPNASIFGGPFFPYFHSSPPGWLPDEFGRFWQGDEVVQLPYQNYWLAGGNMVLNRSVCDTIGLFDGKIGMKGGQLGYGGETFFYEKALTHGLEVYYAPEVVMDHLVREDKFEITWHLRSAFSRGKAAMMRNRKSPSWGWTLSRLAKIPFQFLRHALRAENGTFVRRTYYALKACSYSLGTVVQGVQNRWV